MNATLRGPVARPENLADRIRQLAHGRDSLDVAQFQFVGLEDIRQAYGERWPAQKARIHEVAETFLRSRLSASDLLVGANGGFVLVFGAESGAEAEVTAGQLSHGLNEFFLGVASDGPAPRFDVAHHPVPTRELANVLGDVSFVSADARPDPARPTQISALEWRFQPVWDVKRETLSNWYVAPYIRETKKRLPGYQFETGSVCGDQFAAIDESCLWLSEQAIEELVAQGKQALIGVSIHARTLTNVAARSRILSVLDHLDRELFRYRVVKIAGVAPGFPRLYLNEFVRLLKGRTGNVVIGAAWDEPDMAGLLQTGAVAVGVTLPVSIVGLAPSVSEQTVLAKLAPDVRRAHAAKVRFFVEGDIASPIARKLSAIGVDNISSPRIWPTTGTPDAMLKWPASGLAA